MASLCKRLPFILIILALFVAASTVFAVVPPVPATPRDYVVDLAGIVNDNAKVRLDGYLKELEQKTTAQFVVLTVTKLQGEPIEQFSIDVAHNRWKLGQKGKDNGVLLVVALKDRKYRFEIGYGLEGVLPDSFVGTVGRQYLVPYFRKGDFSTGIFAAVVAVSNRIAASQGVRITGMPQLRGTYGERAGKGGIAGTILTLLFFVGAAILFIKNPRLFLLLLFASSMGGRRGGWGGGGFGGGGFGGGGSFGGGGGGGFGGGGASGGW
ncbi:MAG: TPM domain-containing protein [Candidatus Sulfobium sp.]|jgi:uncharacterized protein